MSEEKKKSETISGLLEVSVLFFGGSDSLIICGLYLFKDSLYPSV